MRNEVLILKTLIQATRIRDGFPGKLKLSTLTCSFLFPGRTSILGISFGAAFLSLAFILFVCFAGQLLVGTSHTEFL